MPTNPDPTFNGGIHTIAGILDDLDNLAELIKEKQAELDVFKKIQQELASSAQASTVDDGEA